MREVGIGIIGTGFARRVQIPAFLACEGTRIVSVASGRLENARATASEFGISHFTGDWRETIEQPAVDLICITTPPSMHREMSLAAIGHGKHVLCEKPMAMNMAEAAEMTAAAAKSNRLALVDHELRFQPGRRLAFEMLRSGDLGTIRHAKAVFQAPHRGDDSQPWDWWSDKEAGGGALGAIGSHIIDSFQWFLGTEISRVYCQLATHINHRPSSGGEPRRVTSDDEANLLVRFADSPQTADATGLIAISMTQQPSYRNRIEFFGSHGALRIDHLGEIFFAESGGVGWTSIDVDLGTAISGVPDTGFSRAFTAFAPRLIDAIRLGSTSIEGAATFADGQRIQAVLNAARRSNETNSAIDL